MSFGKALLLCFLVKPGLIYPLILLYRVNIPPLLNDKVKEYHYHDMYENKNIHSVRFVSRVSF